MDAVIAEVLGESALILIVSSLFSLLAQRVGQPRVVGQVFAGVLLGPVVLGHLPWHVVSHLFPARSLVAVSTLANIAIVLFMFVVGYELDVRALRGSRRAAPIIAGGSLLLPMGMGVGAALLFGRQFQAIGESHHGTRSFILFMGVVVSITALPVLAAIVRERGIAGTTSGMTATAAAAIMDVLAWLVLAAVLVGSAHAPGRPLAVTVALALAFTAAMLLVVRPVLGRLIRHRRAVLSNQLLVAFTLALGSAWVTATLGLHPVFGGFLAGLTMPSLEGGADAEVLRPMEEVAGLLLPLFFVVTGLSLDIGSFGTDAFVLLVIILAIAVTGKMIPGYFCSRVAGIPPRDSAAIAALISTRGLTELIALNIGLTDGIIGKQLFSILVIVALATTVATGPLLTLIKPAKLSIPAEHRIGALSKADRQD
jgi:K+:H+ antiporter